MKKILLALSFLIIPFQNSWASSGPLAIDGDGCRIETEWFPLIGFGTYPLKGDRCYKALDLALRTGYRFIDTATFYDNFEPIADVLRQYGRRNFYIISKVWPNQQTPKQLRKDLEHTLDRLRTDYLDAYLLHWPNCRIPIEKTLFAMEKLRRARKIRHIGLSNITVNHLRRALEIGVPITWVQIEMHPNFCDMELLEFCHTNRIIVQAWAPLGRGRLCRDSMLERIGRKYRKTPSQVAIRWIIQHGCLPLPSSKEERHIQENFEVFDFVLTREEMQEIDRRASCGTRVRFCAEEYCDEFDFTLDKCWPKSSF